MNIVRKEGIKEANLRAVDWSFGYQSNISLYLRGYNFDQDEDGDTYIQNRNTGEKFYLVDKSVLVEFLDESRNKDYYNKIFGLDENDVVLNIGAHIGTTVTYPAERCDMVYAVEPNPETARLLKKNVESYTNVEIIQAGCWKKTGELEINFGKDANDDSFLKPDDGGTGESAVVKTYTVDDLVNKIDDDVSFLKVEAEGAEPEVLEGISQSRIEKVVVKVDEERDGESPIVDVVRLLDNMQYDIKCRYPYIYAKLNI